MVAVSSIPAESDVVAIFILEVPCPSMIFPSEVDHLYPILSKSAFSTFTKKSKFSPNGVRLTGPVTEIFGH